MLAREVCWLCFRLILLFWPPLLVDPTQEATTAGQQAVPDKSADYVAGGAMAGRQALSVSEPCSFARAGVRRRWPGWGWWSVRWGVVIFIKVRRN